MKQVQVSDNNRFTLRMAKENSKIIYRGEWAKEERAIMEANGYKNGDDLSGKMFPTLYEKLLTLPSKKVEEEFYNYLPGSL
jgi:hypothetical protein